ncbi:hypothetical protein R83H12_00413 [Fibrobacteria bacterium R8-3-H12]
MKRGPKPKYKNEKERKAAHNEAQKRYAKKRGTPDVETRLSKLESEVKDILLDLEECLKDNKRIENLVKYGGKK